MDGVNESQTLLALMNDLKLDWLFLSAPDTVAYATGLVQPIETGASPFVGGPTLAVLGRDGSLGVVGPDTCRPSQPASIFSFPSFYWAESLDVDQLYDAAVRGLVQEMGIGGRIGYERRSLPAAVAAAVKNSDWVPADQAIAQARCIKSPREIACLTRSAQAAARGQEAALLHSVPDRSELSVFATVRCAMEEFAGERVPVAGDYLSGIARTSKAAGWPNGRIIADGDPIICDLAPRVDGYWGDSCGSFAVGAASPLFRRLFLASQEALATALEIMRPGLAINELDSRLRAVVDRRGFAYPHHSGHSIGTSVHEWPRIVPYETALLREGMVLMVEPSAYDQDGGGARLEWMVLVERDGCRPLAPFEHRVER